MKKKPSGGKQRLTSLIILAFLCVAGAELAACSIFAPTLYERITAPIRRGLETGAAFCAETVSGLSLLWADLTAPKEALSDADMQLAGEPALFSNSPISDPSLTELKQLNGQAVLTGGTIPIVYYNQGEEPWAEKPYGSDQIADYACGPVAMSMAVSSMTSQSVDPAQMAQWAVDHEYWAKRSGSYLSIVEGTAKAYGLSARSMEERTAEALESELLSGNLLVALMGPGHFTAGGHFILLRGVTLSGTILVADPNSTERSLMEWDPQLILDELSTSTASGAPLWVLSAST